MDIFFKLRPGWLLVGFFSYLLNYMFRASRLKGMIGRKNIKYRDAFNYASTHGVFSYFLPLRSGDVSLPVMLKASGLADFKRGVGILFKTRLLDIAALGMFSLIASYFGARMIPVSVQFIWGIAAAGMTSLFFLIGLMDKIALLLPKRFSFSDTKSPDFFLIRPYEFYLTLLIWTSLFLSQFCMIRSIGLDLSVSEVLFILTIQFPMQLIPIQGFANSGNHEGGWVAALVLMGFSASDAMAKALASHCVLIVYVLGLGLVGILFAKSIGSAIGTLFKSIRLWR